MGKCRCSLNTQGSHVTKGGTVLKREHLRQLFDGGSGGYSILVLCCSELKNAKVQQVQASSI